MKKLFAFLALLVCLLSAPPKAYSADFVQGKAYYIDASDCTWFFDSNAIIKIWDGKNNVVAEKVTTSIVKFIPTNTGSTFYVKRVDPSNDATWNECAVNAPSNTSHNCLKINATFTGVSSTSTYVAEDPYDFSGNTKPKKIGVVLTSEGSKEVPLTYDSSSKTWKGSITPVNKWINFKVKAYKNDTQYTEFAKNIGSTALDTWTTFNTNDGNSDTFYNSGLTENTTYTFELTGADSNSQNFKWRVVNAPVAALDFSTNTNPTAIKVYPKQYKAQFTPSPVTLTYNAATKQWTGTLTTPENIESSHSGYINFSLSVTDNNGQTTVYYVDGKGATSLGAWVSAAKGQTGGDDYYQGGLKKNTEYLFTLRANSSDKTNFDWCVSALSSPEIVKIQLYDQTTSSVTGADFTKVAEGVYQWNGNPTISNGSTWYTIKTTDSNGEVAEWAIDNTGWWWNTNTKSTQDDKKLYDLVNAGTNGNKFCFASDNKISDKPYVYVTLSEDKKRPVNIAVSAEPINFVTTLVVYPRQAAEAGNDFSAWTEPAVYITANYLNDNRISPDWEMKRQADGSYTLDAVTLRGNQSADGANADKTLVAHIFTPSDAHDGTYTETTVELKDIDGLETATSQQLGRAYDLVLKGSTLTASKNETIGTKMPFISLVGTKYVQENAGVTPRGKNTDNGWQESWILYGANAQPIRDVRRKYIYSTQWPPRDENTIYFYAKKGEETIGVTSDGLVFDLDLTTGKGNDLTGAEWMAALKAQSPVAYNRIEKVDSLNASSAETMAAKSKVWLDANTKYARYTINNVWLLGATKIWTGWGGQSINDAANWSNHANWGIQDESKKSDEDGYVVKTNRAYTMGNQYSNFMFDQPTYFRTVEFFLPLNADGSINTAKQNEAVFLTTQTIGDIKINAKVYSLPNTGGEKNSGQYDATMDTEQMQGYTYLRHRIVRYDANKSNSAEESTWTPAGTDYIGAWQTSQDALTTGHAWTSDWRDSKLNNGKLAEGRYFYVLEVEFKNDADGKTVTERVPSPYFTIYYVNYSADPQAFQVYQILDTDAAKTALASKNLQSFAGKSVAYDPELGACYEIDTNESSASYGMGTEVPTATSHKIVEWVRDEANTPYYLWTADVWVKAFDANSYRERCRILASDGSLSGKWFNTDPNELTVNIRHKGLNKVVAARVNRTNLLYSALIKNNGNLDPTDYQASLGYETYMSNATALTSESAAADWAEKPADAFTPVVPMPAMMSYVYRLEDASAASADAPEMALEIESCLPAIKDYNSSDGVNKDKKLSVKLPAGDLRDRNLTAEFSFNMPNVNAEILNHYDIQYDVDLYSSDSDGNDAELLASGSYYDVDETRSGVKTYKFEVKNVHPESVRNPRFIIKKVVYKPNKNCTSLSGYKSPINATYYGRNEEGNSNWSGNYTLAAGHASVSMLAPSKFEETTSMSVSKIFVNRDAEYTLVKDGPWVIDFTMKGFNGLNRSNGQTGCASAVNGTGEIQPTFYHIESVYDNDKAYSMEHLLVNDGDKYYFEEGNMNGLAAQPVMHQKIAEALPRTEVLANPSNLKFYIAPVYILRREPKLPEAAEVTGLEAVPSTQSAAPKLVNAAADTDKYASSKFVAITGNPYSAGDGGVITGVENVNVATPEYDAEYYTVSGIRVAEPQAGQIYIVRRGPVVTKELFK